MVFYSDIPSFLELACFVCVSVVCKCGSVISCPNHYIRVNHLSIAALFFSSPYGYLGQLVLFYIFVNSNCVFEL